MAAGAVPGPFVSEYRFMLKDSAGKVLQLDFSKLPTRADPGSWLVRRSDSKAYFELPETIFQDLKTDDAKLVMENPLDLKIDESYTVELVHEGRTETFNLASGWPSAAAIIDAAMRLNFLGVEQGAKAQDLSVLPPTHILRIKRPEEKTAEISFYRVDPKANDIKTVIAGEEPVFFVSKEFFETIFVPSIPPAEPAAT